MKKLRKRTGCLIAALLAALILSGTGSLTAYAYPGTISQDTVNVRAQASTGADVVTRLNNGATIEIEGEEVAADGQTWYKITVNGQTGYVRADLVTTDGNAGAAAGTSSSQTPTQAQTLSEREATVNTADINVRSGAGRDYASAGTLALNATVTVTGEANDSTGAKWYRIRYNGTNEGYVLADFLDVKEPAADPAAGASNASSEAASEPVTKPETESPDADNTTGLMGKQYTVAYELGDDGQETPFLVDNNSRTKWSVTTLINDYNELVRLQGVEKTNNRWKLLCLILGILTLGAIALAVVLLLRYRRLADGGYGGYDGGGYDDEEEDDYDDEEDDGYDNRGGGRRTGLFGRRKDTYDEDGEDDEYEDEEDDYEERKPKKGGLFSRLRKKRYEEEEDDEEDDEYDDEDGYAEPSRGSIRRVYTPERPDYDSRPGEGSGHGPVRRSPSLDDDDDDMSFRFMDGN